MTCTPTSAEGGSTASQLKCSPSDYVPQVGDVVEFEWHDSKQKGLIYQGDDYSNELSVIHSEHGKVYCYCRVSYEQFSGFRKTGTTDSVPSHSLDYDAMVIIAKAYFSAPSFTGSYAERQKQWLEYFALEPVK